MEICPAFRDPNTSLWMITMGPLILGMNAAFGLLEAGSVQSKNVLNIMMKNLGDLVLGGVAWYVIGYRIAFTHESSRWPQYVADESLWFFQWSFAATAATIDSGTLAERVNFLAYCLLSFAMTAFIYPVVVSWVWNPEGWLFQLGFVDFAGSAVVHMLGGSSALVSTAMLGPRIGRFSRYKPTNNCLTRCLLRRPTTADYYSPIPGRPAIAPITDAVSAVWGVFFLWIGWYGFNPGGVVNVESYRGAFEVGRIAVNTTMGAIGGGMIGFLRRAVVRPYHVVPEDLCQGVLAGLVAVTAGCLNLHSGTCFLLGCFAAALAFFVKYMLERAYIDDVVAAIPVHGACGLFGTVMVGLFAAPNSCSGGPVGVFFAKDGAESQQAWRFLGVQILGCLAIAAWSIATTFICVVVMNQIPLFRFRLPRHVEILGLDEHEHDMPKELESFLEVLKSLVQAMSQPSPTAESVRAAAITASQRLTFPTVMAQFRRDQLEKMKGMSLRISDIKVSGAKSGLHVYCSSQVVMLECDAEGSKTGGNKKHSIEYYVPRWTPASVVINSTVTWPGEIEFPDFHVPLHTEDSMGVTLVLTKAANDAKSAVIGTAQVPFKSLTWTHDDGDEEGQLHSSIDVPLATAAERKGLMSGARLTARISMAPERRQELEQVTPTSSNRSTKRLGAVQRVMGSSSSLGAKFESEQSCKDFTSEALASLRQQFVGAAAAAAPPRGAAAGPDAAELAQRVAELARRVASLREQAAAFAARQGQDHAVQVII